MQHQFSSESPMLSVNTDEGLDYSYLEIFSFLKKISYCSDGSFEVFNPETRFLSNCLILILGSCTSAVLLGPILYRIFDLSRQAKGQRTVNGQSAFIFSLLAHFSYLSYFLVSGVNPSFAEIFVDTTGYITSLLQYIQDGRVWVSSSEVLLYWSVMAFFYLGTALDSYLRLGLRNSILLAAAGLFAVTSFVLELNNKSHGSEDLDNSVDSANLYSKASMSYANDLLRKGAKEPIFIDDLPRPPPDLNAFSCGNQFESAMAKRSKTNKNRVIMSVSECLGAKLWTIFFLDIMFESTSYFSPFVLHLFLGSLECYANGEGPLFVSYYYAVLLSVLPIFTSSLSNILSLTNGHAYIMCHTALISSIYRKAMRLSPSGREKFDSSKIMNLITVDTDQVHRFAGDLPILISAPIGIIISTYQLWKFLGSAMFASLVVYGMLMPVTGFLSSKFGVYTPKLMDIKDKRNKLTSNLFRSIKSLKLYSWETPFYKRIIDVRKNEELILVRKLTLVGASLMSVYNATGDMVAVIVFTTFLWLKEGVLNSSTVFPCLLLFQLATVPFQMLPDIIVDLSQMLTSQRRINELFCENDQDYLNYTHTKEPTHGYEKSSVTTKNAFISWNGENTEQKVALRNISFEATRGELVCITGRVGSGKSALLRALSGDLSILCGNITVNGALAYCTQDVWLQNLTLKENILFGQMLDEKWYKRVIDICQLQEDIKQMPEGDSTDIGERGITLSGGQKARVALARAIYARADIYLFDDVLSAVDEHVSSLLIEKVFSKDGILGNRTIILATNNVKVLSLASKIIELADKTIAETGTFQEIVTRGQNSKIYRLIEGFGHAQDLKQNVDKIEARKPYIIMREKRDADLYPPSQYIAPLDIVPTHIRSSSDDDEEQEKEAVSLSVFKQYFQILPKWMYIVLLFFTVSTAAMMSSQNIFLGFMTSKNLSTLFDARWYLMGYLSIVITAIISLICSYLWGMVVMGLRISNILHNRMLWRVMHAPMSFFDTNPLGRLINRFTRDVSNMDMSFPRTLYHTSRSVLDVIVMLVVVICGSPITALVIVPLGFLGNNIRHIFVPTQRKVSRMESAADSPILSHIEESLKGQLIVRSFDRVHQFSAVYEDCVNYWIRIMFVDWNLFAWLSFRIRVMSAALILVATFSVTWLASMHIISVGYCGVVVSFASSIGVMLRSTLMDLADLEVSGVSLDRILEYNNVEQEAAPHIEATEPASSWPASGVVKFHDLSARYKPDGPDVLKNLSFTVNGSEKIGIVGRTGSGKSSLTMALFRILESHGGQIDIDDINTSVLGLSDLRSRLSIIPQDSQIFDGTVRENLDPLNTSDDVKIWEVLELCHLKAHIESLEGGLDAHLADGGENLSRGQAQLVCLGRALVHEAKVLVLDEATASVDVETDRVIQETIRKSFSERTIITVAHRLNTIMDSDRILVLDNGEVKEFDTPQNLLESKGMFYSLYTASQKSEDKEESS